MRAMQSWWAAVIAAGLAVMVLGCGGSGSPGGGETAAQAPADVPPPGEAAAPAE
ncbi:MAG: hypothetical protein IRY99_16925, partial [Isosphaeraceae bacterium]|nr:hypothetical protein [Isosphaeraceae bacterium]